jgi:hypothetical protein
MASTAALTLLISGTAEQKRKWREFEVSMLAYFDKALSKLLLFASEREQHDDMLRRSRVLSTAASHAGPQSIPVPSKPC